MAALVTVYRTEWCAYCMAAKRLLGNRGIAYTEVFLDRDADKMAELKAKLNYYTVPMIFIGEEFIGGYAELRKLDDSGQLQAKLAAQ